MGRRPPAVRRHDYLEAAQGSLAASFFDSLRRLDHRHCHYLGQEHTNVTREIGIRRPLVAGEPVRANATAAE